MVKIMQEVTIKKDNKITLEEDMHHFLNPKYAFVPVRKGFKLKITNGEYVYKHDILAVSSLGRRVAAPVSGRVIGLKHMNYWNERDVPSLVIENDFKENTKRKRSAKKDWTDCGLSDVIHALDDVSAQYKGVYLSEKLTKAGACLIINAVEVDAYFENKHFLLSTHLEDILETCDLLASILKMKRTYFVLKNTDAGDVNKLMSMLGTYPNINLKLISPAYPNGLAIRQKSILKEDDALVFDVQEIYMINKILHRSSPVTSKLITITGSAVKPRCVIQVKKGSLLSEVFVSNFDFTASEIDVYINGYPYGKKVTDLKFVIDDDIDGVFVDEKSNHESSACLNCGQCIKACPIGLNPKYVFDHDGKVSKEYYETCLDCGLCNYVCPANRDLRSSMMGCDKE